uniref:V-type proton ATPase subunit S1/VOA1 transmembrane domain-containing protein n=1 Tax=Heliothis virescens TaxID=7102 RepID=A0A2A4JV97_HELVI
MSHVEVDPNPFTKLSSSSFANIVHESVKRTNGIIIFVEETFCTEDISAKDKYGTPYVHLHSALLDNKVKYFPSVIDPFKILNNIFKPQQHNVFYLASQTKLQIVDTFNHIYIFFQDGVNETRAQILRRHDTIIREVVFVVRQLKPGPIVAFYTGKTNPVVVKKIEQEKKPQSLSSMKKGVVVVSSIGLFRLHGVYAATQTRRSVYDQVPEISKETLNGNTGSTIRVGYPVFDIEFAFTFNKEGWTFDSVSLYEVDEEVGRTNVGIYVPWNHSLFCPEPIQIINQRDLSFIVISQYQVQPKDIGVPLSDEGGGSFSDVVHCGPYFTSPILACLFVSAVVIVITLYGIITLFDCVSGDRYEDPNAKPLTHEVMH